MLEYRGLRVGGQPRFGWCCGELCPGAGVPLRPNGGVLALQQLVVEKKEETNTTCERTCKGKSGGRSGGSLGNKWRQEKGTLGNGTSLSPGLRSRKGVARTFGALAGVVPGDLPVSRARVFGYLPEFLPTPSSPCTLFWPPLFSGL